MATLFVHNKINAFPSKINPKDVSQIEFQSMLREYLPLYAGNATDKVKINQLVSLYNEAVPKMIKDNSYFDPVKWGNSTKASIILSNGETVVIYQLGPFFKIPSRESSLDYYYLKKDRELQIKIRDTIDRFANEPKGITIEPSSVHLGESIHISGEIYGDPEKAQIELVRDLENAQFKLFYYPKLKMQRILVKTVPVIPHNRVDFQLTLSEQIGIIGDGSPGKLYPGEWTLEVRSYGGGGSRSSIVGGQDFIILE